MRCSAVHARAQLERATATSLASRRSSHCVQVQPCTDGTAEGFLDQLLLLLRPVAAGRRALT